MAGRVGSETIPAPGFWENATGAIALAGIIGMSIWFLANLPDAEIIPAALALPETFLGGIILAIGEMHLQLNARRHRRSVDQHPLYPLASAARRRRSGR